MGKATIAQLVVSDKRGRIRIVPGIEAAGMKGGCFFRLSPGELIRLPAASRILMLPGRLPVGYDLSIGAFSAQAGGYLGAAAFLPPGFTATLNASYKEKAGTGKLPLFSYAAIAYLDGGFYVSAVRVDKDIRHDPRHIDLAIVRKNAARFKKIFPRNRLIPHLKDCALMFFCPNAQNFFLGRFEAPLPVSPLCNARCAGCISYQPPGRCPAAQPRIKFMPEPREVAEIALFHINNVKNPIVSFGQGCEGEPLMAAETVKKSIQLIRKNTSKGTININTNAGRPDVMAGLFDAGLDSMRVSLNSAREKYYAAYYRPKGYSFRDVLRSVKIAKKKGGFVSVNYLTMPGFTDSRDEFTAFRDFIRRYNIDMVQWRNLNYDPLRYFRELGVHAESSQMLGIRETMALLKNDFPKLKMGYFNPVLR